MAEPALRILCWKERKLASEDRDVVILSCIAAAIASLVAAFTVTSAFSRNIYVKPRPIYSGSLPVVERNDNRLEGPVVKANGVTSEFRRVRARCIWHDFVLGIIVTVLLIMTKVVLERTTIGKDITLYTYDWLHGRLSSKSDSIVVADINNIPMVPQPDGVLVTSRPNLSRIIMALGQCHPRAVGVDIDFSPENGQYCDQKNDQKFFDLCLRLGKLKHIPIFLGVDRTREEQPDEWLKGSQYEDLAVNLLVPKYENRVMPLWFRKAGVPKALPSMCLGLARSYLKREPASKRYPPWFAETTTEKRQPGDYSVSQFFVDFSPINDLVDNRIPMVDGTDVEKNKQWFAGKVVILGKADPNEAKENSFVPPGSPRAYPGTYFHSCAANTLIERPLYELTPVGRLLVDAFISLIIFGTILGIRLYVNRRMVVELDPSHLQIPVTIAATLLVFIVGVVWINQIQIIWDDFLLVLFALWLHMYIEPCWNIGRQGLRRFFLLQPGQH